MEVMLYWGRVRQEDRRQEKNDQRIRKDKKMAKGIDPVEMRDDLNNIVMIAEDALEYISDLEDRLENRESELEDRDSYIYKLEKELEAKDEKIEDLEEIVEDLRDEIENLRDINED